MEGLKVFSFITHGFPILRLSFFCCKVQIILCLEFKIHIQYVVLFFFYSVAHFIIIYIILPHFISQKENPPSTASALLCVLGLDDTGGQG